MERGCAPDHHVAMGECLIWKMAKTKRGYGVVFIDGVQHRTHRFAYMDRVGVIPDGYTIDHICRNKSCCNPNHLEAVSAAENTRRAVVFRRQRNGKPHSDWTAIRAAKASGMTYRQVAEVFGMSVSGVYSACNKK